MIALRIEGLDEAQEYLDGIGGKASSDKFWGTGLGGILEEARRFAASISPVITGSYRGAHRVVVGRMQAGLGIDPAARNAGVPVTRYAGAVEERHHVYARTAERLPRLAAQRAEVLGRELLR